VIRKLGLEENLISRYYDDDDDEFDIEIEEGSIEDAEELLARLDKIFVKSSYDIFARDDLLIALIGKETYVIDFIDGYVSFLFSDNFLSEKKGICEITINSRESRESRLSLDLLFMSKNNKDCSVFYLELSKDDNTLVNFGALGDGGCTINKFLVELMTMGVSFPNNFGIHMNNFMHNCMNTFMSLFEQRKFIKCDE